MVEKEDVLACYKFLLDRLPENDTVVDAKCQATSVAAVVASIVTGQEFLLNHKSAIATYFHATSRVKSSPPSAPFASID